MGIYLNRPSKEKYSRYCENCFIKCGVSSMQGWRFSQEDSHNFCINYDEINSLFAVYDGHGGREVAMYASQEYPKLLKKLKSYQKGKFEKALKESFLMFDATLKEPNVTEILKQIASGGNNNSVDSSSISAGTSGINIHESIDSIGEENIPLDQDRSPDNSVNSSDPLPPSNPFGIRTDSITAHTCDCITDLAQKVSNQEAAIATNMQENSESTREEELIRERNNAPNLCSKPGIHSGCTAVVAIVTLDKIYVANAGDSRAVLCKNGQAVDMSIDHKPHDFIEYKRIKAAGGYITSDGRINGGLNLSRAFGDHQYKASKTLSATQQIITALPDIKVITLTPDDEFLVLACDGIWNSLTSQNAVDFIRPLMQQKKKLSRICEMLMDSCLAPDTFGDGSGCDNMTCIIIQFLPNLVKPKRTSSNENLKASEKSQSSGKNKTRFQPSESTHEI